MSRKKGPGVSQRFVWSVVIYVKKNEGDSGHPRAITTQMKTHCTDILGFLPFWCASPVVLNHVLLVFNWF